VKTKFGFVEPMLSLAVAKLPEGPAWSYELKFDGYRVLGLRTGGRVQLFSRNGKDFTKRFASIASALPMLGGEIEESNQSRVRTTHSSGHIQRRLHRWPDLAGLSNDGRDEPT
jgi:ATP-dependent DNA ligase